MMVWLWVGFMVFVLAMLAADLFLINRKPHVINTKEALAWTGVCIFMALLFNVAVYFIYEHNWLDIGANYATINATDGLTAEEGVEGVTPPPQAEAVITATGHGKRAATEFFTGWLIEYSLSMDNIFVIALIFAHFRVPQQYQHRLLFWGILGALVLRGVMILAGAALVKHFEWVLYLFGIFLVYTGVQLFRDKGKDLDPESGWVFRMARRILPIAPSNDGPKFTTRVNGRFMFTPLFVVLLVIESSDVVFAVDSIPAIFGITRDPFLVFTSNVFAILGLRSLYFALAALMDKFRYAKYSLGFILAFVGVKMMLEGVHLPRVFLLREDGTLPEGLGWLPEHHVHISPYLSLGIIAAALVAGIVGSVLIPTKGPVHIPHAPNLPEGERVLPGNEEPRP